ncbi:MAG: YiiX/YebB-like N1pC/P60 family cysteine hydrolase [Flavisolibacter sp.]
MRLCVKWIWILIMNMVLLSCTIRDKKPADSFPVNAYAPFYEKIKEGNALLKDGDLVLRAGEEMSSQLIKQINRQDQTWSHSGIVFYENGYPYIYHIVTGDENPSEKLIRDSLARYSNPRKNSGFAIYRYDMNNEELQTFRSTILDWYKKDIQFDSLFNLKTDDKMYCSEMIRKALTKATNKRIKLETTEPTDQEARYFAPHLKVDEKYLRSLQIVTIDNLFLNANCRLVKRFDFTQKL